MKPGRFRSCSFFARNLGSRAVGLCLALPVIVAAMPARAAEPHGLALNWVRLEGAERCISAAELMNTIEAHYGGRILFERSGTAPLSVDGYVQRVEEPSKGWLVTLGVSNAAGEVLGSRKFELPGDDCKVAAEAADLAIRLTLDSDDTLGPPIPLDPETVRLIAAIVGPLDPDLVVTPSEPQRPIAGDRTKERDPQGSTAKKPGAGGDEPNNAAAHVRALLLDAAGTGALGRIPGLGFGGALHLGVATREGWIVELGVTQTRTGIAKTDHGQAGFEQVTASLAVCPWQAFSVMALCGGAEYGRMAATPSGFMSNAASSTRSMLDVLASGVLRIGLIETLFVRGALTLTVPLLRNDYVFDAPSGARHLFRASPVAGRAELGIGLHL